MPLPLLQAGDVLGRQALGWLHENVLPLSPHSEASLLKVKREHDRLDGNRQTTSKGDELRSVQHRLPRTGFPVSPPL